MGRQWWVEDQYVLRAVTTLLWLWTLVASGIEDTTLQHPTGYACTVCRGVVVVDTDGTYLCAVDAIATIGSVLAASTTDTLPVRSTSRCFRLAHIGNHVGARSGGCSNRWQPRLTPAVRS